MADFYNIPSYSLIDVCTRILSYSGVPDDDARVVAESLVEADLRGVSSHGVLRLSIYMQRLQRELIRSEPSITTIRETQNTAVLDGNDGFGQVVSQKAVSTLLEKAASGGISAVAARKSNHYGAAAYWASRIATHDMIGISMSNVQPLMSPPGGVEARVGNNPLSIVVPAGREKPMVLDMATSTVPLGKILAAKSRGESIPEGWALDRSGQITTDPDAVVNGGSLFPASGPKGYGLAVMVDVLTSLLSEGEFGREINSMYQDMENPNNISHFFMGIPIANFLNPDRFRESVDRYINHLRDTPLAEGAEGVFYPGEIEHRTRAKRQKEGIDIPRATASEIVSLAQKAGVEQSFIEKVLVHPVG